MSLHLRFILFSLILILLSFAAAWSAVSELAEDIIEEWAVRYAEKQVLYDRQRTLQPIIRELALSRQFAQSIALIEFAQNPYDPVLRRKALQEMENFRYNFLEMNYFVALYQTGEYFHNDANNTYQNRQLRYTLNPDNPDDAWFYELVRQNRDLYVNVNKDTELGVTKLWIDILLKEGDQVLGIVGTGLNLSAVLEKITRDAEPGVSNIFVDYSGAIQLHENTALINFSSISQPEQQKHRVEKLLDQYQDRVLLKDMMQQARQHQDKVFSHYVSVDKRRNLMAVAYLPEIDWYEITLIDIETLLPISRFSGIFIVYGITLVVMILLLNLALRYLVLNPLSQLNSAMVKLKDGQPIHESLTAHGELNILMQHFRAMADAVAQSRDNLEQQVQERTHALETATRTDPLTGLLNRRGMMQILEEKHARSQNTIGLLWFDLDFFKEINDQYGHAHGDKALIAVSAILQKHIDSTGVGLSSRWGGDELLACVDAISSERLLALAETVRFEVEHSALNPTCSAPVPDDNTPQSGQPIALTVSIGAYLVQSTDSLSEALHQADTALYKAKSDGRNLVRLGLSKPTENLKV